ncbi:hypothetical protein ACFC26_30900 [Kitasatospora purpeofusca]|uniref:hypothetical protein n=1 Tax=Kitasatospora purpeofusca TaxID=67352 RepID=UPI0035DE726B
MPGASRDVRRWRLVEIRRNGTWTPALLTVWRRPPTSSVWVIHVTWSEDGDGVDTEGWSWFLFDSARIRPLAEPSDPPPAGAPFHGRWRDAAVHTPSEPTGTPEDTQVRCWALAWARIDGQWRSGLVTAQRRTGPGGPWIASFRWGEDRQCAWLLADGITLRPVHPAVPAPSAPGTPQ